MNEGLTSKESSLFMDLMIKANDMQVHSMLLSLRNEKDKRENR